MKHSLKCWPDYFQPILDGIKTFDLRFNDRKFNVGDNVRRCALSATRLASISGGDIGSIRKGCHEGDCLRWQKLQR